MVRYALPALGVYVWIASARSQAEPLVFAYRIVSAMLLAYGVVLFSSGAWFA